MGKYRVLGSFLDRVFRNNLNANFDDVDADIQAQKKRVDDLIIANPQPSEVQDARGGFTVLRDRLNNTDAQLAEMTQYIKPTGFLDDTAHVQSNINLYPRIVVKAGKYFINAITRINLLSNRHIEFEDGAIFQCITNGSTGYKVIYIGDVENVTLVNPVCIGDRNTHTGTTGEWGFGIDIRNSKNVKIYNPICKDMWGDGICFTEVEDLLIENAWCDNNRRQGISIGGGKNVKIVNPLCENTNGTSPQAGIDIEPDANTDMIDNIQIINPVTKNNVGSGLIVSLGNLVNSQQYVNLSIINHRDYGSHTGLSLSSLAEGNANTLNGLVSIETTCQNNKIAGVTLESYAANNTPMVELKATVINCNSTQQSATYGSGISLRRLSGNTTTYLIGNIKIINPTVIDTRTTKLTPRGIDLQDDKGVGFKQIVIVDPLEITGIMDGRDKISVANSGVRIIDGLKTTEYNISSNLNIYGRQSFSKITTFGAASIPTITMADVKTHDMDTLTLEVTNVYGLKFVPASTEVIRPLSSASGQAIQCTQKGATITLYKKNATEWFVDKMVGTWTVV